MSLSTARHLPRPRELPLLVGLALLYAAVTWLGLRGVARSGVIPTLCLASGVGLAALWLGGPRLSLAVLLGAFVAYLGQLGGLEAAPLAVALAASAALQAWIGALLLRHVAGEAPPPTAALVLRAIGVTVLAAMISPAVGVLSLGISGSLAWGEAWGAAWRWWVSVAAGMLIAAPALIVLGERYLKRPLADSHTWPLAGLMAGLALVSFLLAWEEQDYQLGVRLRADGSEIGLLVDSSMREHQSDLAATRALFAASEEVGRTEFNRFVEPLLDETRPIRAISWAPLVPAAARTTFERELRTTGLSTFVIFELDAAGRRIIAGDRDVYYPATFIEPLASNLSALGFDLGSEAERMRAIARARDTGLPSLTAPIRLVHAPGAQSDLLLITPLYTQGKPLGTLEERRARLAGVVYGVLETKALLDDALATSAADDVELYLFDVSDGQSHLLSARPARSGPQTLGTVYDPGELRAGPHNETPISLYGRTWLLLIRPGPAYLAEARGVAAWARLLIGLFSAALFLVYMHTRQRAEARLRASERRGQLLLQAIPDLLFRITREGVVLDYVASAGQWLYSPPAAFLGRRIADVLPPEVANQIMDAIGRANASGREQTIEYQLPLDGQPRMFEARLDSGASEGETVAIVRDVTESKQAERRLRWLSRTYRVLSEVNATIVRERDPLALFDAACHIAVEEGGFRMAWVGLYDAATHRVWPAASAGVTEYYLERLNITVSAGARGRGPVSVAVLTGAHTVVSNIEEDPRMAPWRADAMALGYRACACFPLIVEGKVDGVLSLYSSEADFFDEAELRLLDGMAYDIAYALEVIEQEWRRRRAEEQLRASERRGQALLRAMPDLMLRLTPAGMILDYAASDDQPLPAPSEELIGQELSAIFPRRIAELGQAAIGRALETGTLQTFVYQLEAEGSPRFYEARVSPNAAEDEAVVIVRDISEARRSLAEITQLSRVVEQMDDLLMITDVRGHIQYVNPAFERELGYTRAEAVGQTPRLISSGLEGQEFYTRLWESVLAGGSFQAEIRNRRKDGRLIYEDLTISPVRDEAGVITHFVATGKDITARKEMERDLHERLKELTCLRQVQRLVERDLAVEELCPQVVAHVVAALRSPEAAAARLELDGQHYGAVLPEAPPERRLGAEISVSGTRYGRLAVTYRDECCAATPEEQNLLDGVAHSLGLWLERRLAEEALTRERNSLALRVAERTADLSRANHELARAVRAKDNFLATMSHELRTPLNAILALSEGLLDQLRGPLNERQNAALGHIESSGRHLLSLINDILDLSKVEAGHIELQLEHVLIHEVCQASLVFVKEQALRKQIKLGYWLSNESAVIYADPKRLKQVLVNLLSNAVKFTPAGGAVSLEVDIDAEAGLARFAVRDTGIGIASNELPRLFQPFVQLDSSLSRQHEGTGLGLALVRRMTELHGGSVSVESEPGRGSLFAIALPYHPELARPEAARAPNAEEGPPVVASDGPGIVARVLLVEDNELNIVATSDYLQEKGYQVAVARNGREALELAEAVHPDLVLMDVQMPVMDGLEATRQLRARPAFATTPIVALTALAMPGDRERCMAAGANAYLTKPISLKGLVLTIEAFLRG